MGTQNERRRNREREIQARFVGTPAERKRYQGQKQDEDHEGDELPPARHRLEDVAQRIDGWIGVNELIGVG